MSEEVSIRLPEATEAQALLTLMDQLQQESHTFSLVDADEPLNAAQEADQLVQIQQSTRHLLLVASVGPQLIGVCSVAPTPQGNVGELGVAVAKAYWHVGIGTALVDEALYWLETASDLQAIGLEVQTRNVPAVKLYQKLGFERTANPATTVIDASGQSVTAIEMVYQRHSAN